MEAGGDDEQAQKTVETLRESCVGVDPEVVSDRNELSCENC